MTGMLHVKYQACLSNSNILLSFIMILVALFDKQLATFIQSASFFFGTA